MGLFGKGKNKDQHQGDKAGNSSEIIMREITKGLKLVSPFVTEYEPFLRKPWTLKVEFQHSSSKTLPQILKLAKTIEGFSEEQDENGNPVYQVTFGPLGVLDFDKIYSKVKSWKGTLIYINGQIVTRAEVAKWLICYRDKIQYLDSQPLFCWGASTFTANIFGCHRTKIRDTDWNWNSCWYSIGELDDCGIFHVDKQRIVELIIQNLKPYRICPALNPKHLELGMRLIPDTINPREDSRWKYYSLSDGNPIGVIPSTEVLFGEGYTVPMSPQYADLTIMLEHKLKMGEIEVFETD